MLLRSTAVLAAAVLLVSGCDEKKKLPADVQPMEQLKASGKSPLELTSSTRSIAPLPGAAAFTATVKNVSDRRVTMFKGTMVVFDGDGKALALESSDSGWSDLSGIEPGEAVQLQVMVPSEDAARLKLVFREVMYDAPNPLGKDMPALTMAWKNAKADAEVTALKGAP